MATYQFKPSSVINTQLVVTKPLNLKVEIPNVLEETMLSYNTAVFGIISNHIKSGSSQGASSSYLTLKSFGFDTLPITITSIPNKKTKEYSLKI